MSFVKSAVAFYERNLRFEKGDEIEEKKNRHFMDCIGRIKTFDLTTEQWAKVHKMIGDGARPHNAIRTVKKSLIPMRGI